MTITATLMLLAAAAQAGIGTALPPAPTSPAAAAPPVAAAPGVPVAVPSWHHAGSDIPADPAWRTGTLANGVRYAVRRNALPAGSIAIRVRIDAGGLHGSEAEAGWAHIVEHMTFRGTEHYGDGEGSRIWQRLGASFGVDTNAFTTPRATTYVLDLPRADADSYRLAMAVVGEMMQSARIDAGALAVEKRVVLAERAARLSPFATKVDAATRATILTGTKMAQAPMIGTDATIAGATAPKLHAFYKRWYRPERAVVVVVGDADPTLLEQGIRDTFGGWRGEGAAPAEPDYGAAVVPAHPVAVVADPQAAKADQLVWVSPHDEGPWTIARQQRQNVDFVADALLRRRLAHAVEAGGALVSAGAGRSLGRHIEDQFAISFIARPGQTRAALDQIYGVINDLVAHPPATAEVEQQVLDVQGGLVRTMKDAETARSAALANGYVSDVDTGDVSPTRRFYLSLFLAQRSAITPAAVQRALKQTFAPDPRLLHLTASAVDAGAVAADLAAARRVAGAQAAAVRAVSMTEIAPPGPAGTVAARNRIDDLGIDRVRFANGVTLDYKRTGFERDTIRVRVLVGHGALASAPNAPGLFWTGSALGQAGIGPFNRDELTKLTDGRQIGFGIGAGTIGVQFAGQTNRRDLPDMLRLMTAGLTGMRYAEGPVQRLRDNAAATYQTVYGQPGSVLSAFGSRWFYGGDTRFRGTPEASEIARLTLADFQRFWTDQLSRGPIRVVVVGDLDGDQLVQAVAASFGALPARTDVPPPAASIAVTAARPKGGVPVLRHRGDPDQASVARVYPVPPVQPDLALNRALGIAGSVIEQRLVEEFREQDGGTYSPFVSRGSSPYLPAYGTVIIGAQLRTGRIAGFQSALDRITADLAANGPGADALARAKATQIAGLERAQASDNAYWLAQLSDNLADPRDIDAIRTAVSARRAITADDVRRATARWLTPANSYSLEVLPTVARPPAARPAGRSPAASGAAPRRR